MSVIKTLNFSTRFALKSAAALTLIVVVCVAALATRVEPERADSLPRDAHRWQKTSDQGAFNVTLDSQSERIALREFLEWSVEVANVDGTAVYPARFSISGGMPSHGHGLPSQPRVTQHLDAGRYLISGLKFNMAGDWLLVFDIESESRRDRVSFEFNVAF